MTSHFEESLQRDLDRIRGKVTSMAALDELALKDCLRALQERNRQLAYSVILRDRRIDELEKEIDRLCLEFIVRQQPVAGPLRFAYATIKINLELERVGDYAESIARQVLKIIGRDAPVPVERYVEMANLSIPMLHTAVQAFVGQNAELARNTIEIEEVVDGLKSKVYAELFLLRQDDKIPLELLNPLITMARRLERVSDQARNICLETIYVCTGQYAKHIGAEAYRLLFVDKTNACRSPMAEAIGNSLNQPKFVFSSAGLEPEPIDPRTIEFLKSKGMDLSQHAAKTVEQVPNLEHYQVIVALAKQAQNVFSKPPTRTVCLDWNVPDPSQVEGTPEQVRAAYEETYQVLRAQIHDLLEAVLGDTADRRGGPAHSSVSSVKNSQTAPNTIGG